MRGAMYNGIENVSYETFEKPVLKENSVMIKNIRAGICGTDLTAYLHGGDGVGIMPGNQFGHEMVGVIDEIAENVEGFEVGQRVFVNPGNSRAVPEGWNATMSTDMRGAFSEYVCVEDPKWGVNLFKLPDNVDFDTAALIEPMSVGMNGVFVVNPKPGEKAIIYGAGPIGLAIIPELQSFGVKDIIISDRIPLRLEAAAKLGAIPCDASKYNINDFAIEQWGSSVGNMGQKTTLADIVIDCAGYPGSISDFKACAKLHSRYAAIALGTTSDPISTMDLVLLQIDLLSACAYTPEVIQAVIDLLATGADVSPIITDIRPLSDVSAAFHDAADREHNIKVILDHSK